MKKILISLIFSLISIPLIAQSTYESVLKEIETNSFTLNALREQMDAQKLNNRTGIFPDNPEVEFHYLWGNPASAGNRIDFTVTQSFDFPTVYSHRSKLSNLENANIDLQYKAERINLLLSAKKLCIELVYFNALAKEYSLRLQNAEQMSKTYKTRLDKGAANILESNKAQLNLIMVQGEVDRIETERKSRLVELKRLNGGKEILFDETIYPAQAFPANFDEWLSQAEEKSPVLQYVTQQIEIERQQVKLNKSMWWPKFFAGYMSENTVDDNLRGVTVGMSVPLWENKNRAKQAKAQLKASESVLADSKMQFYNDLQRMYLNASNLQRTAVKYRAAFSAYNNEPLLKKALDAGEISMLIYLQEIEYYYTSMTNTLEAERDFALSAAELSAMEL